MSQNEEEETGQVKEQDYLNAMPNQQFDEAVTAMQTSIQNQIAATSDLISDKLDVQVLVEDYSEENHNFIDKLKELNSRYSHVRKTRGDGNCFFRAFGFGYLEHMLQSKEEFSRFKKNAELSFQKLMELQYPSFTVEDFYENFMSLIKSVGHNLSLEDLITVFRDEGMSNYCVVYLRLITSCQLQNQADFYQNFLDDGKALVDFCKMEVEPMYQESDHIHISALSSFLEANVRVAYIDQNGDKIVYHDFPEGCRPSLHLLYRPGHYDILYPR